MLYRGSQHVKWSSAAPEGDEEKKQAVKTDSLSASKMYSNAQPNQVQGIPGEYPRNVKRIPEGCLKNT